MFIENNQKYLFKFSFMNNFDIMWYYYAYTLIRCDFGISLRKQERLVCLFVCLPCSALSVIERGREGWEKNSNQAGFDHIVKTDYSFTRVVGEDALLQCYSSVLGAYVVYFSHSELKYNISILESSRKSSTESDQQRIFWGFTPVALRI